MGKRRVSDGINKLNNPGGTGFFAETVKEIAKTNDSPSLLDQIGN